jgi:uncharacterized protein (DUF697 family)
MPVRVQGLDGSVTTVLEFEPADLGPLRDRISTVLEREGDTLRAGNLLLRAHLINADAKDQLSKERDVKAQAIIEKFQWMTAGTVFANPVPALDLMATGAVQYQMISEIAAVYGVELSTTHIRMIGTQMIQMLLKTGLVEATTSLIAGLFKSSLVGYAAGGAVQAVSMAYLAHVSGNAFADYFRHGQSWGDGGMGAASSTSIVGPNSSRSSPSRPSAGSPRRSSERPTPRSAEGPNDEAVSTLGRDDRVGRPVGPDRATDVRRRSEVVP